ncbi:phosphatidylinositol-specific phospholipase C [Kitasatospora sp. NPDC096147]|uniref:phosphatidylinositol-specific phospholipase C n=1 Tax=Kitasatospora sp. NPDC096147 TaxID=3364093 RepID=UPI0037FF7CE2
MSRPSPSRPSPSRREVLRWGAGAGGTAVLATLGIAVAAPASAVGPSGSDWMAALDGGLPLTRLTIPGTHDSWCTDPANGTEWSHTQNWGLPQQLEKGIRFFDIRLNGLQGTASELGVYHDRFYQYHRFQDVLNACRDHLRRFPGEVLVMRVRNERAGGQALGDEEFARRIGYYLDDPAMNYRSLFWTEPRWPRLGEARGRIVFVADFGNSWPVIQWSSGSNGFFRTQDTWQGVSTGQKSTLVEQWFDRAFYDQGAAEMYVNFTSYANGLWPKTQAGAILPRVFRYLDARKTERIHLGIVPMDFPDFDERIVGLLIGKNFL